MCRWEQKLHIPSKCCVVDGVTNILLKGEIIIQSDAEAEMILEKPSPSISSKKPLGASVLAM